MLRGKGHSCLLNEEHSLLGAGKLMLPRALGLTYTLSAGTLCVFGPHCTHACVCAPLSASENLETSVFGNVKPPLLDISYGQAKSFPTGYYLRRNNFVTYYVLALRRFSFESVHGKSLWLETCNFLESHTVVYKAEKGKRNFRFHSGSKLFVSGKIYNIFVAYVLEISLKVINQRNGSGSAPVLPIKCSVNEGTMDLKLF